ncbi:disulfide bond formation protein DsbA [Paucibacter sp. KBW04]|uniref:thiol:disulfide interchange protein DsbA/DsbL n=1 Tax=Paucibacter sp. KBW04 TaxID=2153361 RepID=UPI000F564739|nr:thiol:disulfide interchange protein DsbA/DsbL [Paucibacter sp. KBW04]RQO60431.1 disulfide bond formation protein DsbA [Paucibacter sp. KBW04]
MSPFNSESKPCSRRHFCRVASAAALPFFAAGAAYAQGKPVEGQHYRRLRTPQNTGNERGEVLEFFWYGCPACYKLEPALNQWLARKPADVSFKRVPSIIHAVSKSHQRIFYALDAMGLEERLHAQVFAAVQADSAALQELPEIQALMSKLGVDAAKFAQVYGSFSVQSRCQQADRLIQAYEGTGVPMLAVNGRFVTTPAMAGGDKAALTVVDYLLGLGKKA